MNNPEDGVQTANVMWPQMQEAGALMAGSQVVGSAMGPASFEKP